MDRIVLVAGAVLAGVLIALAALWALRDYANPIFVNGAATATLIDGQIGNVIAARFPAAEVGSAHCPPLLNLTGHRTGQCTLPVAGGELRIAVAMPMFRAFGPSLSAVDALFVREDAERAIGAELAERYGEDFTVRCPSPAVQVIADATSVDCAIEAPDVLRRSVEVRVSGYKGVVHAETLSGIATRRARVFGRSVAERTEGEVAVSGSVMERFLRGKAAAAARGEVGRRGLVGTARCPNRIVLREGRSTRCTVGIGGLPFRYDVHFEKGLGLYATPEKDIEVIAVLREISTRYFERPAFTGGKPLVVHVDCGIERVAFIEPGASVPCTATVGKEKISFEFEIEDPDGGFQINEN